MVSLASLTKGIPGTSVTGASIALPAQRLTPRATISSQQEPTSSDSLESGESFSGILEDQTSIIYTQVVILILNRQITLLNSSLNYQETTGTQTFIIEKDVKFRKQRVFSELGSSHPKLACSASG